MKGFIAKAVTAAGLAGGLAAAQGCYGYRDLVDPCWPERYNYAARQEVRETFAPQVNNGHVLDQTVWNYDFEAGTDKLTPGGLEHLGYMARRRPSPDPVVFLQTAQDIAYSPTAPEKFSEERAKLDSKRMAAIEKYLTAYSAGRNVTFKVMVHDPAEVGQAGVPMRNAITTRDAASSGILVVPRSGAGGAR